MQQIPRRFPRCIFLLLSCLLLLAGCQKRDDKVVPDKDTQSQLEMENAASSFHALTENIFLAEVTADSITLHYTVASPEALAIPDVPASLGSVFTEPLTQSAVAIQNYVKRMETIDYEALPRTDKITYDILKWQFDALEPDKPFPYYDESISPTIGIQAQLPILLAEYEFRCSADIEDYLLLLRQLPDYYGQLIAYEQKKSAQGLFMADFTADAVISQCQDFLCDVDSHFLASTFANRIDAISWLTEEQKTQFKQVHKTTLTNYVYPAYQSLIDGLNALKGTGTNPGGLCNYPDGKAYYAHLVRLSTGSDSSPQQLIERTQAQIQSDLASMSKILNEQPSTLENLHDLSVPYTSPEDILAHLKTSISEQFPDPPNVECTVKYVDASLEKHLSPAFYLTPPIDRITSNVIYINKPSFRDDMQLFTTLAHEGYPGHLYQNIFTQNCEPDKVRALFSFPGFAEGYATYAELYAYDYMGLAPETSSLLKLSSSVTLGLYAYLDLSIHEQGWTLEDAKNFLVKYGIQDESVITEIYQTIVAEPANYLKYYIGYLELITLRAKAEESWGDKFSEKRFHQYILETGDAPFSVLEKYLD